MGSMVLLDLMGGLALLLWALIMVQTGILHAFGSELRHESAQQPGLGLCRRARPRHPVYKAAHDGADDGISLLRNGSAG
jgi:hypothetical protein